MDDREAGTERPIGSGAAAPGRGGRMSRQGKTAAVLRLLRGEELEMVSRALGVTTPTLTTWRDAFQDELRFLGIESSPAFVRANAGNGCAERFIRTLQENPAWVRTFETVEDLRLALLEFRATYNTSWLIERHGFIVPAAVRQNQLQPAALAA
jgi:transposase-like protein